jgi:hypothetical protein
MKKIIRLTEDDLTNLVKRVINEDDNEKKNLIELLKSDDISNIRLGLQLYKTLGIKIPKKTLNNAKARIIPFMIDEYEWDFDIIKDIINDIFVDDPEDLEEDDYIDVIIEWIIDNDFDVEEWFEEVNESYN